MSELIVKTPDYATDGSKGYYLELDARKGWAYTGRDGTAYATLDSRPWTVIGKVDSLAEFTPEWVQARIAVIRHI